MKFRDMFCPTKNPLLRILPKASGTSVCCVVLQRSDGHQTEEPLLVCERVPHSVNLTRTQI